MAYNFVNSIKGGCGKTTFSILLVNLLQGSENKKTLLIDMDLQGTAMQKLLLGNDKKEDNIRYLNEAIRECESLDKYIYTKDLWNGVELSVILADPNVEKKKKYRPTSTMNYNTVVQYQVFRGGFSECLNKLDDFNYANIIFDMPPNYDGYSNAAYECIRKKADENDKVNLFYVTGLDNGQVSATMDEIVDVLNNQDNLRFDNLFIVFNDNVARDEDDKKLDDIRCTLYDKAIDSLKLVKDTHQSRRNKIHLIYLIQNKDFSTYCIKGKGLFNKENDLEKQIEFKRNMIVKYVEDTTTSNNDILQQIIDDRILDDLVKTISI